MFDAGMGQESSVEMVVVKELQASGIDEARRSLGVSAEIQVFCDL